MATKFDFSQRITSDINLYAMYTCGNIDPENPTIANLKLALATGSPTNFYPIGTLIPTRVNATNTYWRIVHYGTAKLASTGIEVPGAYLMLTQAMGHNIPMNSSASVQSYQQTNCYTNFASGGTFYKQFDETIINNAKEILAPTTILNGTSSSTVTDIKVTFFPPSYSNINGETRPTTYTKDNGPQFDYYVTNDANSDRAMTSLQDGRPTIWRTRDAVNAESASAAYFGAFAVSGVFLVNQSTTNITGTNPVGYAPCCFISA